MKRRVRKSDPVCESYCYVVASVCFPAELAATTVVKMSSKRPAISPPLKPKKSLKLGRFESLQRVPYHISVTRGKLASESHTTCVWYCR